MENKNHNPRENGNGADISNGVSGEQKAIEMAKANDGVNGKVTIGQQVRTTEQQQTKPPKQQPKTQAQQLNPAQQQVKLASQQQQTKSSQQQQAKPTATQPSQQQSAPHSTRQPSNPPPQVKTCKPNDQTKLYFETLFSAKPENEKLLVWTLPDRHSNWCDDVPAAIKLTTKLEQLNSKNIYVGASTASQNLGPTVRGKQDSVASMFFVWTDIDINGPGHKTQNCAPNEEAANDLIAAVGAPPSMVVFTGGGLHAYWIFKEPWTFENNDDRNDGYSFSRRWTRTIQQHAESLGFKVDSTFDLSRVLRIPGTHNRKPELKTPVLCEIRKVGAARYDPSELEYFLFPETDEKVATIIDDVVQGELVYDLTKSSIDMTMVEALREAESRFGETWDRTRKDTKNWKDSSPSGWDMSLASFAAHAGWTKQQIINLLIAYRIKHGEDMKRADYYFRTAGIAMQKTLRKIALEDAKIGAIPDSSQKKAEKLVLQQGGDNEEIRRLATLDQISDILGIRIVTIIKYEQDPPKYKLETARGSIELGDVGNLINQATFRNAVAAATGRLIAKTKTEEWDSIAQMLLDVCQPIDTGPETTDIGAMRGWLVTYLDEQIPGEQCAANIANQTPIIRKGESNYIYFFMGHFRKWLDTREGERINPKATGLLLRKFGCNPLALAFEVEIPKETGLPEKKSTTRNVWRVEVARLHGNSGRFDRNLSAAAPPR